MPWAQLWAPQHQGDPEGLERVQSRAGGWGRGWGTSLGGAAGGAGGSFQPGEGGLRGTLSLPAAA